MQRVRLLEAVIDAPLPGNKSINKDCIQIVRLAFDTPATKNYKTKVTVSEAILMFVHM